MPSSLPYKLHQSGGGGGGKSRESLNRKELIKIGRILVKKSGKVVMRVERSKLSEKGIPLASLGNASKSYVDLEVS